MSRANKVFKNSAFVAFGRFFEMAVLFVVTPFVFKYLGDEKYGIWSLVFVLSGFIPVFAFEIGRTYTKYIAEYYTKGENNKINEVFNTGLVFYTGLSIILVSTFLFVVDPLVTYVLKIPGEIQNDE